MSELIECDYCGQFLDPIEEDAELYPIFVGEPPNPPEIEICGRAEKQEKAVGYTGSEQRIHGVDSTVTLDHRLDHIQALLSAIESSPHFQMSVYNRVQKSGLYNQDVKLDGAPALGKDMTSYEVEENEVEVKLKAQTHANHVPDLMVCKHCKDILKGGGDD